jgi:pimeloyl-ACP methyl ester carboxylesterase
VLETEELSDAIVVGHSYGARPAALAAAAHGSVRAFVSLDGVSLAEGSTLVDDAPAEGIAAARAARIDGIGSAPPAPEVVGVPADHPLHPWVARRLTAMAYRPFEEPMPPLPPAFGTLDRLYVEARDNRLAGPRRGLAHARAEGWDHAVIASGHDLMVTAPDETADLLIAFAARQRR